MAVDLVTALARKDDESRLALGLRSAAVEDVDAFATATEGERASISQPSLLNRQVAATYNLANLPSVTINHWDANSPLAPSTYAKVPQPANVEPTSPLKFQSADGYWFLMSASRLDLSACGGTLQEAVSNAVAHATVPTVMRLTNNMNLTEDVTVPRGWRFIVDQGQINTSATKKLTLQSQFKAAQKQIFTGTGTVVGLRTARPEWWGAIPGLLNTAGVNCAPGIQAAINCVEAPETSYSAGDGFASVLLGGGHYAIDSNVILKPTNGRQTGIRGQGTSLGTSGGSRICARFSLGVGLWVQGLYSNVDNNRLGQFRLEDFVVQDSSGTTSFLVGIQLGSDTATLLDSAPTNNRVSRVSSFGFQKNWRVVNARNIVFDDIIGQTSDRADAVGISFEVTSGAYFCGDCVFTGTNTQFITTPSMGFPIQFIIDAPTALAELRGVKFITGGCYGGSDKIRFLCASTNINIKAYIGHIWFAGGFQLDAGGGLLQPEGL